MTSTRRRNLSSIQALQDWVDDAVANLPLPASGQPVTGSGHGLFGGAQRRPPHGDYRHGTAAAHRPAPSDNLQRLAHQQLQPAFRQRGRGPAQPASSPAVCSPRSGRGLVLRPSSAARYGPPPPPASTPSLARPAARDSLRDFVAYRRPLYSRTGRSASSDVTAAFTRQAEQDLVRFLRHAVRGVGPWARNCCWPARAKPDQVSVCDGSFDVLNDACLDPSPPADWNERSMNA